MDASEKNQKIGKAPVKGKSNSFIKIASTDFYPVSKERQIDVLLELRRSQEENKRIPEAGMDKPGAANSRQTKACKAEQFTTAWVLREAMAVTKTTHKELCERHGMYHAEIELILRGGHVSLEMALKLQSAFGSPAQFWIKLGG